MEARELRIGNIISYIGEIETVNIGHLIECENSDSLNIQGVPITEEWLIRLGFEKDDYCMRIGIIQIHYNYGVFDFRFSGNLLNKVKYVHQLQNLYFVLTNQELTYNEKD